MFLERRKINDVCKRGYTNGFLQGVEQFPKAPQPHTSCSIPFFALCLDELDEFGGLEAIEVV